MVILLIVSTLLSGCSTTPSQNANLAKESNKNATPNSNSAAAHSNAKGAPEGFVDAVQGETKAGGSIIVMGWAADVEDGAPVKKVEVLIDNNVVTQATLGKDRVDVATVTGRSGWQRSGWEAIVSLANVAPGRHKLSVVAYDSAGTTATLTGGRDIDVAAR